MANINYGEYLQLDKILNAQAPESDKHGKPAHDETLFIIVHQTYELWFKQIHHELDFLLNLFGQDFIPEKDLGKAVSRLHRIIEIQKILVDQLGVLETMTPMDFLDFRDFLTPASGFQSTQFRALEIKLGLPLNMRGKTPVSYLLDRFTPADRTYLNQLNNQPGLFQLLEKWLERIPFMVFEEFNFWEQYAQAVEKMFQRDLKIIQQNPSLSSEERQFQIQELDLTKKNFQGLLSAETHRQLISEGKRRLSQKATLSALFIHLYRDEPVLDHPFRVLTGFMDIDELLTSWRQRHALMAHRMIGTKIGTGGSSGHAYLKNMADKSRIFVDLYNLSTFLIPRSSLPKLPSKLKKQLGFHAPSGKN